MEEPSVLDYVKAKLKFWKKSDLNIPAEEPAREEEQAQLEISPYPPADRTAESFSFTIARMPWLTFLAIAVALAAQFMLEPPHQTRLAAAIFYFVAAVLTGLAAWTDSLMLVERRPDLEEEDFLQARWKLALSGGILSLAAFATLGGNLFTALNLILWLGGLGCLVAAFWQHRGPGLSERLQGLRAWLARPSWNIQITRWTLLVLVVLGLVAFFRLYNLSGLPGEMVSDHAEKLIDVRDLFNGRTAIFFERNTGREAFQFYWTALMALVFGTGVSFMSLKIGTVLVGLITLFYMYRLGDEVGGRWVALFTLLFAGVAYWPNIISRIGLRFPLYPFCVAPVMFYLIRGLRTLRRNDFIWAGLWLGLGLHGYTSSRVVPLLVVAAVGLFLMHPQSKGLRGRALAYLMMTGTLAFVIFIPLVRYALEFPYYFNYRTITRLAGVEQPLPGPAVQIFFNNLWRALTMFFVDDGSVWVHSVPYRPALDVVMAALFFIGLVLLVVRYLRSRHWLELFLLISIPILLLPSVLSLAFPNENPNLNRTAGAYVPVFLIAALAFDGLLSGIRSKLPGKQGLRGAVLVGTFLVLVTVNNNADLFFNQYNNIFRLSAWNTAEMGQIARQFTDSVGTVKTTWVVAFPYWVDTRLVGIEAGYPYWNPVITKDKLETTLGDEHAKLFMLNIADLDSYYALKDLYPEGRLSKYNSPVEGKTFYLYNVPAKNDVLPINQP